MSNEFSSKKTFVAGVIIEGRKRKPNIECPNEFNYHAPVYPYLSWIRSIIKDDLCLNNPIKINKKELVYLVILYVISLFCIILISQKLINAIEKEKMTLK